MRLTYHTDYALRLLMLLAVEPDKLHTIEEIAKRYDISKNHMMKVSHTLVEAGFVHPVRGRNGGLRLAMPMDKINLGQVIRATEDNFNLVECFDSEKNKCLISKNCGLKNPLQKALISFLNTLDQYSLKDLVNHPGSLSDLQGLSG
ncbi:RrF2 family transcriptional regulator [Emcibacter sp.]|uniref:RrF2 family transcriptional regulator n=1 Tax=Emcibacter sp. TaxID=1979954 RepID=UPI003A8E5A7E